MNHLSCFQKTKTTNYGMQIATLNILKMAEKPMYMLLNYDCNSNLQTHPQRSEPNCCDFQDDPEFWPQSQTLLKMLH